MCSSKGQSAPRTVARVYPAKNTSPPVFIKGQPPFPDMPSAVPQTPPEEVPEELRNVSPTHLSETSFRKESTSVTTAILYP